MDESQDTQIIDGEIQGESQESTPQKDQATVFLSLENLIKNHLASLERLQKEFSEQKEMIDNVFSNDETFRLHSEKAKEAAKVKSSTRAEILKRPQVLQTFNKMKGIRSEINEQKTTLSELLEEFRRTTGFDQIEDEEGKMRKIVTTARLVRSG